MIYPPLAEPTELSTRLDVALTVEDLPRMTAALDDASALVRAEARQTWVDDLGALEEIPDAVVAVVLAVARRAYENRRGVTSETTGPFTVRYSDQAGEGLFLTDTEKELLARYRPSPTPGIWALPTTRTDQADAAIDYFELDDDAEDFGPVPSRDPW